MKGFDFMRITGDFENAIIKMIKEETLKADDYDESEIIMYEPVEIYEVEEWKYNSYTYYDTDSYSENFTTLEEAIQHFNNVVKYGNDWTKNVHTMMKSKATHYTVGYTLRKVMFDLLDENSMTLDRDIVKIIKEFTTTITSYN